VTGTDEPESYRRAIEGIVGIPATEGNAVDVLRNGDRIFPAMLDAIRGAERTVDFMTFVYWTGDIALEFADALAARARDGARVRILLDAIGARHMDRALITQMQDAGAMVEWFRPPTIKLWETNHRTHRKVLVCDEEVAFTGGVGIAEEWCGDARNEREWRETHVRVRGPAVDGLRAAFAANWAETGRPLFDGRDRFPDQPAPGESIVQVVRGQAGVDWNDMATLFATLITRADRRIRLTTAYFVPDERFVELLGDAVERGVEIEVLVPGPHVDKRVVQVAGEASYEPLLDRGVQIACFQPTMLHAKVLTVDQTVSCVGSANFNNRSLSLDDEAVLVVLDPTVAAELDAHFDDDLDRSVPLDPAQWRDRSRLQRAKEKVVGIIDDHL
jgi:cardiolipin synthase